jgi:hypothetical protein
MCYIIDSWRKHEENCHGENKHVVHVFSTYLYTSGNVQCIGLILLLRDERGECVDEKGFCCIVNSP